MPTSPPHTLEYAGGDGPPRAPRVSRLALATPLLPLVSCSGCLAFSFVPGKLTGWFAGSAEAHQMIRTLPFPLAAAGVAVFALARVLRRQRALRGIPWAVLGLAINLWTVFVAVLFAWYGD